MLNCLKKIFSWLRQQNAAACPVPESEVQFLRRQNLELLEIIKGFQPPKQRPANPDGYRPQVLDPLTKKFRPKTDEEIAADMAALSELGVL